MEPKQHATQLRWATCREPYRRVLNSFLSSWISGKLATEEVALELWTLLQWGASDTRSRAEDGTRPILMDDVKSNIHRVAEIMVDSAIYPCNTPEERTQIVDRYRPEQPPLPDR
jgi:hypothetical protein